MSRIQHVHRRAGRYIFRRRVHFRNIISKPVAVALQTADPKLARQRAALLSARFAVVKSHVDKMIEDGAALTGAEIEALFREELERELRGHVDRAFGEDEWSSEALRIAALDGEAYGVLRLPGRLDEGVVDYVRAMIPDNLIEQRLATIGAHMDARNVAVARTHLIRARAAAASRVQRLFDDDVLDAADPVIALMADLAAPSEGALVPHRRTEASQIGATNDVRTPESQFAIYDHRRFGDVINDVLAELKSEGVWKGDLHQQRRIMQTFAWITGNRELGSYDHRDVSTFKKGLQRLPVTFKFGKPDKGAMARAFDEVVAELPPLEPKRARNKKTVNRDLSTMSTVAKHLEETAWKPRIPGARVMDFSGSTVAIKESDSTDLRPPWTTAHLKCLFGSPVYTGGGGVIRRLKAGEPDPRVYHDAAYFAPLLWYYSHACREEICGLEVVDVTVDHVVPHFEIRDNLTRGSDGEKAGEKRMARRRKLPIHPELIRLGLLDYVEAIRAEGHTALFPELYILEVRRGGSQFYERSWKHMVNWIGDRLPIPTNEKDKGADIHSIRSLGSSFYEVDGVNEIIRADIMGHARQGTNARHYSKRIQTEGLDVVLGERLEFLKRYVPVITEHLDAMPIRLLPIKQRSRVGSGRDRRIRSDAGTPKPQ